MSRHASPTLIGAFVLGAMLLAIVAVLLISGGGFFQKRQQYVVYFEGAAQGLQVGSPVLFLGVKVGTVKQIQLGHDEERNRFSVRVTMEMEPNVMRSSTGNTTDLGESRGMEELVTQGLRAQLRIQSLLTGQLYVDLDFHPDKPAVFVSRDKNMGEIPSIPTPVEEFTAKIESLPWSRFFEETAAIGEAIGKLLADPAITAIPGLLKENLVHVQSVVGKFDEKIEPTLAVLHDDLIVLQETLLDARAALAKINTAAESVNSLADPDAPVLAGLKQASAELDRAAQAVNRLADTESPSVVYFHTALQEMSKAARSLKILAETLEQQPESLVRGKKAQGRIP